MRKMLLITTLAVACAACTGSAGNDVETTGGAALAVADAPTTTVAVVEPIQAEISSITTVGTPQDAQNYAYTAALSFGANESDIASVRTYSFTKDQVVEIAKSDERLGVLAANTEPFGETILVTVVRSRAPFEVQLPSVPFGVPPETLGGKSDAFVVIASPGSERVIQQPVSTELVGDLLDLVERTGAKVAG